jgi:hypothetical protein
MLFEKSGEHSNRDYEHLRWDIMGFSDLVLATEIGK